MKGRYGDERSILCVFLEKTVLKFKKKGRQHMAAVPAHIPAAATAATPVAVPSAVPVPHAAPATAVTTAVHILAPAAATASAASAPVILAPAAATAATVQQAVATFLGVTEGQLFQLSRTTQGAKAALALALAQQAALDIFLASYKLSTFSRSYK